MNYYTQLLNYTTVMYKMSKLSFMQFVFLFIGIFVLAFKTPGLVLSFSNMIRHLLEYINMDIWFMINEPR